MNPVAGFAPAHESPERCTMAGGTQGERGRNSSDGPTPTPNRTRTGLARTPDCRATRPRALDCVAARTAK